MNSKQTSAQKVSTISQNKIESSVAYAEFSRFTELMDLDVDEKLMDDDDRASFDKHKRRIIRAIEKGNLVINESGEATFTPDNPKTKRSDPITFYEQDGAALMAIDGKKKNHNVASTFAVMGSMCRVHPSVFSSMVGLDLKVCMALYLLLMD